MTFADGEKKKKSHHHDVSPHRFLIASRLLIKSALSDFALIYTAASKATQESGAFGRTLHSEHPELFDLY